MVKIRLAFPDNSGQLVELTRVPLPQEGVALGKEVFRVLGVVHTPEDDVSSAEVSVDAGSRGSRKQQEPIRTMMQ